MKHKIFGDPLYGLETYAAEAIMDKKLSIFDRVKFSGATRLCLHAAEISFEFKGENFHIKSKIDFEKEFLNAIKI